MINSGRVFASPKRTTLANFEAHESLTAGFRRRYRKQTQTRMGWRRALFSALSICLGLASTFVALHYVPAHLSPGTLIRVSDLDTQVLDGEATGFLAVLEPYWDSLQTRRTYVWAGETIEVKFERHAQDNLQLVVKRCASQLVLEVFACNVESQDVFSVSRSRGQQKLKIYESGFYHFAEIQNSQSRVIWRRAKRDKEGQNI
jgi:hypothetical protein